MTASFVSITVGSLLAGAMRVPRVLLYMYYVGGFSSSLWRIIIDQGLGEEDIFEVEGFETARSGYGPRI